MENSADALKIAFAIFAFVFAITITFTVISQAKFRGTRTIKERADFYLTIPNKFLIF